MILNVGEMDYVLITTGIKEDIIKKGVDSDLKLFEERVGT